MSTVKVNTVDKRTGSTLTLGGCGTTVTLGAGATQSGFGRTGTVDWCTTAKTSPFTGVSGNGYFVNTTCGAVTVTLPASPSAGDIISIADYASTFQTNNLTICRNSSKINGQCANASLSTQGQSITLVYVDATKGWKNTMDSTSDVTGLTFITATGGTETTCGDFKIHTFTSDATFCVSALSASPSYNNVSYMVVAGGGSGATSSSGNSGGAGGAGGFREGKVSGDPYIASPLAAATGIPVSITSYPITVGGGGASVTASPFQGINGSVSVFSTITSAGGGGAGSGFTPGSPTSVGLAGGSGGGGGGGSTAPNNQGGAGNTPPVSPPQGNPGGGSRPSAGPASDQASGGGGGAGGAGSPSPAGFIGGAGGAHVNSSINGSDTEYAGGAGGTGVPGARGTPGGGGAGSSRQNSPALAATSGTANTGGGGGGAFGPGTHAGESGGSGIVIIRYRYQ